MAGLSQQLFTQLRDTLLKCNEFDTDAAGRASDDPTTSDRFLETRKVVLQLQPGSQIEDAVGVQKDTALR